MLDDSLPMIHPLGLLLLKLRRGETRALAELDSSLNQACAPGIGRLLHHPTLNSFHYYGHGCSGPNQQAASPIKLLSYKREYRITTVSS